MTETGLSPTEVTGQDSSAIRTSKRRVLELEAALWIEGRAKFTAVAPEGALVTRLTPHLFRGSSPDGRQVLFSPHHDGSCHVRAGLIRSLLRPWAIPRSEPGSLYRHHRRSGCPCGRWPHLGQELAWVSGQSRRLSATGQVERLQTVERSSPSCAER